MRTIRYAAGAALATVLLAAGMTAPAYAAPVTGGAFCDTVGATGETANGTPMVCSTAPGDDQPRWREAGAAETATPTTTATPTSSPTPTATATPTAKPTSTATPRPTPTKVTPVQRVTATYGCGTATFSNPLDVPVTIMYGPAQTDSLEGTITVAASTSKTVKSTNEQFGWTARNAAGEDVGHLWLPGKDLSCDDTTRPPGATPAPGGGLADTGI